MKTTYNYIYVPEELPDVPSSTMEVEGEGFYMKWAISMRYGYSYYATLSARVDMDAEIVRRINGKKIRRRFRRSSTISEPRNVEWRTSELLFTFIGKVRSMLK